jgi:hypothetical protein
MRTMSQALAKIQDFCGLLLLRFIDLWLYTCGRCRRRADVPWLICPTGPPDRIGDRWYEQLAASENLSLQVSTDGGLIPDWNQLRGPSFDPDWVHPAVKDFYEHTSRYSLEAWSEVTILMRFFLWGLVTFASRRMQQLNFPVSSMELAGGMSSEILELEDANGRRKYTGWLRRMKKNGYIIYAGIYTTSTVPGHDSPCVKVSFPVPLGSSTVFLRPENQTDGSFKLISQGKSFGDSGFYRLVERGPEHYQVRYLKTLHEAFHVYADEEGVLRTDHSIRYLGLQVMRLHYKIQRKDEVRGTKHEVKTQHA